LVSGRAYAAVATYLLPYSKTPLHTNNYM